MSALTEFFDYLVSRMSPEELEQHPGPAEKIAEILERTTWLTDPQGNDEISRLFENWLKSEDVCRVAVTLKMEGICPVKDIPNIIPMMTEIRQRWPILAPECDRWIEFGKDLMERDRKT